VVMSLCGSVCQKMARFTSRADQVLEEVCLLQAFSCFWFELVSAELRYQCVSTRTTVCFKKK